MDNDNKPHLLTVKEAAAYLRIAVPTVWRMLHDAKFPRTRIGGRTFIKREALDDFIEENTV